MSDDLPECARAHEAQLRAYLAELLEANRQFNLTAVRSPEEAWSRHIVESATLADQVGSPASLIDIGSGGGLPGMVLAICRQDIQVTLLEATEKKARFLVDTAAKLELPNLRVVCDRAESAGADTSPLRESFDLATARAVAPLRTLLELALPFLKVGGHLLAVKGDKAPQEIVEAERAFGILRGRLLSTADVPAGTLLRIAKLEQTPRKYPRRNGEPKHRPL